MKRSEVARAGRVFEAERLGTEVLLEAGKVLRGRGNDALAKAVEAEAGVMGRKACEAWNETVETAKREGLGGLLEAMSARSEEREMGVLEATYGAGGDEGVRRAGLADAEEARANETARKTDLEDMEAEPTGELLVFPGGRM
jgi:hypothetical protein